MHSGTVCFPLSLYFDNYTNYDFSHCLFVCVFFRGLLLDIVLHFLCRLLTALWLLCHHSNNDELFLSTTTATEVTYSTLITTKLVTIPDDISFYKELTLLVITSDLFLLSVVRGFFCIFLSCEFYPLCCLSVVSACW